MSKLLAEWFWTDRWMGSSAFLLPIEPRGLYREMLTQAWRRGCRLPTDHEAIRRAVGCTIQEWRRCWPKIAQYWRQDGDGLVNDTQLEVWAETVAARERAAERGRKGGYGRAQALLKQDLSSTPSTAQAVDAAKPPDPDPKRDLVHRENVPPRNPSPSEAPELSERAARFMERYAELFARFRHGAKYHSKPHLDHDEAMGLVAAWDDTRLDELAEAFFTTNDKFCRNGSGTIAQFRSRASWCDAKLKEKGL